MLAKRIIPCLDVTNGRVVKGTNFVDLVDAGDPVESAVAYNEQQADEIVFLDITASSDGRETMVDVVRETAAQCFVPLTVGSGIREVADMSRMLLAGADKGGVNTAAIFRLLRVAPLGAPTNKIDSIMDSGEIGQHASSSISGACSTSSNAGSWG